MRLTARSRRNAATCRVASSEISAGTAVPNSRLVMMLIVELASHGDSVIVSKLVLILLV